MSPKERREAERSWGSRVSERREDLKLSQAQVVKASGGEVTQQTISKIENNEILPRPGTMQVLARALGTTVEELFPWSSYETTVRQVQESRKEAQKRLRRNQAVA